MKKTNIRIVFRVEKPSGKLEHASTRYKHLLKTSSVD